jgi:nucleoside phosphorylase
MVREMRADIGILCALREHLSYLLSVSTPLSKTDDVWLVERDGQQWALAHQGRTSALSYQNAQRLIDAFLPATLLSFGPAALVGSSGRLGSWYMATRCAALRERAAIRSELIGCRIPASTLWTEAALLISAPNFVTNHAVVDGVAQRPLTGVSLLDMTGYGVSRACAEADVPWMHFRWTTDRAGDTAVAQFAWNVRDLAKRGHEVLRILQETRDESCIAV